ncbi:MAG TPA: dolichyl-phosphate beta-glucosyltransferase [Thermodesulfovibrionales bacterium]|nr:dolichyl-phosphate beta-glucosyltransferase [Thermodesulfovibrionales bacterium]
MGDSLSVIIPAYNEGSRIPGTLRAVGRYLRKNFDEYEIIVVDDGSSDDTSSVVSALGQELHGVVLIRHLSNTGKGSAVRTGVLSSTGKRLLMCDADLSTPIEEYRRLGPFLDNGFDIAIGSRGLPDSDILVRQPWYRETMGKTFNLLVRMIAIGGIKDTQCGFKLFRGEVARSLFSRSCINGFGFDVEVLFLAKQKGHKIKEVPIKWINSPHSRVSIVRDPLEMLSDLIKIRVYWFLGKYNKSGQMKSNTSQP